MAEESSLRNAISKIMDWPTGGTAGGAAPRNDVVNLGTTATLENAVPPPAPDPFAAELAALQTSNAALSTQLATPIAAAPTGAAATTEPEQKRISYTEFYRGRPEEEAAMKKLGYGFYDTTRTDMGVNSNWVNGNPYQYRNEYNAYLGTLAPNTPMAMNEEVDIARAASRK